MTTAPTHTLSGERELFRQMAEGSEEAFTKIFYHYTQRIYGFILAKTKSQEMAEEIVQEVFIKLWEKRTALDHVDNYEAFILTMAANKAYDFLRRMATQEKAKRKVWTGMQLSSNITDEALALKQSEELIREAVDLLSPQRKKIFLLSKQQGLTRKEIARELNLSPNTVDNHLQGALQFVREYLSKTSGASWALLLIFMRIHN
jgi:RNA polymerase sigma-70 factor (family 1)